MRENAAFLVLAVSQRRAEILRALSAQRYARAQYLELGVEGVPAVSRVSVYAWPEPPGRPTRIGVDIVRIGIDVLERPITAGFDLTPEETPPRAPTIVTAADLEATFDDDRPAVITYGQAEWRLVDGLGQQQEVVAIDRTGAPMTQTVDTGIFCYRLICPRCGRVRYAQRNSIHQIKYCRVCTRQDRLRSRALKQYRDRLVDRTRRRLAPHEEDRAVELAAAHTSRAAIAAELGVTASCISKVLKRKGF